MRGNYFAGPGLNGRGIGNVHHGKGVGSGKLLLQGGDGRGTAGATDNCVAEGGERADQGKAEAF